MKNVSAFLGETSYSRVERNKIQCCNATQRDRSIVKTIASKVFCKRKQVAGIQGVADVNTKV